MQSIFLSLCWKEYRELQWSVLAMLAITLSIPLYALVRTPDTAYFWVLMLLAIYSIVGGICFGMWAAAGERAGRTAAFLAAMPIRPASLGSIKLVASIIAVLIPVLCLTILGITVKSIAQAQLGTQTSLWTFSVVCAAS